jgi:hypothetical protein
MSRLDNRELESCAIETFRAQAKVYSLKYSIPLFDNGSLRITSAIDRACNHLAFQFVHRVYCLGESKQTVTFYVPQTWLDAVVQHFAPRLPRWLARIIERWHPVKLKKLEQTVYARALLPGVPVLSDDIVLYVAGKEDKSI